MKKLIILLLLIPIFAFAQQKINIIPFVSGNDTIFTTSSDTLDMRIGASGLALGPWEELTETLAANDTDYVTKDDKSGERTKIFIFADETWWTWAQIAQLRIRTEDDTLISKVFTIGDLTGSVTGFVQPTIIGDATLDTILYKVRVGGL